MRSTALAAALLLRATATAAPPAAIPVPGHGALLLQVPAGWQARIQQPPGELPPTIRLTPASGRDFAVLVTALWSFDGRPVDAAGLRAQVEGAAADLAASAAEPALAVEALEGPAARGFFVTATDRAPRPGDWTHVTQGAALAGDLILSFTILTNGREAPARRAALAMIGAARQDAGAQASADAAEGPALTLPGRPWSVAIELPGFQVGQRERSADGRGSMLSGVVPASGVNLTVLVEAQPAARQAADCRRILWDRAGPPAYDRTGERQAEGEGTARVEYLIPSAEGTELQQWNVHVFRHHDGACISIHASKVRFRPTDASAIDAAVAAVRIR